MTFSHSLQNYKW